ncbi:1-(5-phosphoribosyl)-5-[(5-phosphoribosylamino)methylideneamino]imidazole-4-carboxamide isomerase [Thermomicrobiaceae bacterium CFH 74404]|uniref:1-(5-phosphoribosyl)-5-[(5-phosphoribosylamino)methylideneamino] imidazole-4-carboxamide isomerase n=1 Tax=Thermalbibacter longus TaxID=2951981 RepID=A0AA42BAH3_9BACT|nr:1-(5-phosphoribosyl)-5-[(5-phosphoribosylamino)methylideneamino]imidazole-4-carboxamide isomerase [Thermalbibacter longus]MCM8749851.1 1-(5-phosphoribosyl)-5-[(5-phosphoribosylamino)methylideneamino]imidazole-4-carboxamide isomerase [Thermalbibacter longus]
MIVIPALDLRDGRCVRLVQGDFGRERTYSDDPVQVARSWQHRGAPWLHVVDLDGAKEGYPAQLELVERIVAAVPGMPVQLGGGLRTIEHLDAAFAVGIARAVLGTAGVESPELVAQAVERFGADRIVLGVDARRGRVAVRGWLELTDLPVEAVIVEARARGIERVIYTDIERDGTLNAPNFDAIAAVARLGVDVIASGGVAAWEHLRRLAEIPKVEAAIVGRALYDGSLQFATPADWHITGSTGKGRG